MLDLYYNSKRFRNSLPVALTCFEDAYALFRTLSETIDCPVSHPELCKLLWNVCGEREDLRFPLALDYLLANRGKELPEYLRQPPIEELKARIREFIRSQRKENVRDAMKHLYFAGIEGRVIQIDYASMEWCDITDDFPQISS